MKHTTALFHLAVAILVTACTPMARYQGTAAGLDAVELEIQARWLEADGQCLAPGSQEDAVGRIRFRGPRDTEFKDYDLIAATGRVEMSPTGEPSWPWRVCLRATADNSLQLCTETFGYSPTASSRPQISVGRTCQTLQRMPR
jgi:hypothetical protein